MKGRLENRTLAGRIATSCAHCGQAISIDTDGHSFARADGGAEPLVFAPLVNFDTWRAPSIIDGF